MTDDWKTGHAYDADGLYLGLMNARESTWAANGWVVGEPAPTEVLAALRAAINAERDMRLAAGTSFAVQGIADPIPLTGRPFDQSVYLALLIRAQAYKAAGVTAPVLTIRAGDDVIHQITPDQMISLISQAMAWVEAVMSVSWAMKDGTAPFEAGIPADVTKDKWWLQNGGRDDQ